MLNLLWLLLPVAAAGGWLAARAGERQRSDSSWDYARNFHHSLSALLHETREVPADLFITLENTDRDTADTQLAVGNLFRRRGEVNRAIQLHQSVLDREELAADIRASARFELARDYDSAGLLDRSEQAFRQVINTGTHREEAYECLLQLQERENEWEAAIATARAFSKDCARPLNNLIAHYQCELATDAQKSGDQAAALKMLGQALETCRDCARANMIRAAIAVDEHDLVTANRCYEEVERQRPELMPEIIARRFEVLYALDDEATLRAFVDKVRAQRNAYSVISATRAVIADLDGPEEADRFFKQQIVQRPSLRALRDWARDQVRIARPGEREKVQVICTMLDQVVEERPGYLCSHCGFRGNVLHWRCPSCSTWDSVHTIIGATGE